MVRKLMRRYGDRGPRFLTFSCYRRLALLGEARWRDVFVASLMAARERYGFGMVAWVVMPEHVHLILEPGEVNIVAVLRSIKQAVAQKAIRRWRLEGDAILEQIAVGDRYRFWQAGGGYDRTIRDEDELREKVGYVHQNPVKRELVKRPEDWRWSSVCWDKSTDLRS